MTLSLSHRALACMLAVALPLLIGGCASRRTAEAPPAPLSTASGPATVPAAPGPAASPPVANSAMPLAGEGRWLRSLFSGTPVGIADEPHGALRLTIPVAHGFEPASAAPKPALKAVLDRVGQSLLRQSGAWVQLAAPAPQAAPRQQAMKNHLLALKVARWRVTGLPTAAPADSVVLRLMPGDGPVQRLEDRNLPPPAAGPAALRPVPAPGPAGR